MSDITPRHVSRPRRERLTHIAKSFGGKHLFLIVESAMMATSKGADETDTVLAIARNRPELFGGTAKPILPLLAWPETPPLPKGVVRKGSADEIKRAEIWRELTTEKGSSHVRSH
jgi:hypothetical protein